MSCYPFCHVHGRRILRRRRKFIADVRAAAHIEFYRLMLEGWRR